MLKKLSSINSIVIICFAAIALAGTGWLVDYNHAASQADTPSATVVTATASPPKAPIIRRFKDLEFMVAGCAMVNGPVVCDFVVTNLGQDLENFKLVGSGYSGASEMYDNFGQDYRPVEFQIGSEADNLVKVPRLLSGVPMPARVFFQSVDPAMSSIPLLLLKGSAGGKGFNIAFRNIPLERSEAVATVPTPTSSLTPTPTLGLVQRYKGLEFNLTRCDLIGTQIRCDFNVTNLGRDLEGFRLVGSGYSGASEMYDDLGQVYAPIEFQVANHRGNLVELPRLLSGVPVQGRMFFQNVDPAARRLSLLQLNGRADGGRFTLEFQNIPLTPPIIPPATVEPLPSPELIPVNMIDRYKDLEFNLVGCGLTGTQVVCDFVVTNLGRDLTTFKLVGSGYSGASEMYDNFGQDYRPVEFQIGDRADNLIKVPRLISGLAVQGKVTFQDVEPAMNSISLLQLNGSAGSDSFYIKFKNIPVQQVANVH